jgi:hypothetical protein
MATEATAKINPMEMSDEDIAKLDISQLQEASDSGSEQPEEESPVEEESQEETLPEEPEDSQAEESEEPEEEVDPRDIYSGDADSAEEVEDEETESVPDRTETKSSNVVDYKAEYEKLLSPFKANKREMTVESVEEARQLMQMGVAFSDKMKNLKDDLRLVKTLKKNDTFSEDKINFLIDLDKGNPEAIAKFLKDHKVDPMDLDLEEESSYIPQSHTISGPEYDLDSVLDDISDTPSFNRTLSELGNRWDSESRKFLTKNPELVRTINDQIGDGTYDKIWAVIERERMFGRLPGIPDYEAYRQVGISLTQQGIIRPNGTKPVAKSTKKPQDPRLTKRKRAASPTKGAPAKKKGVPNMLGLSDDEFEKMSVNQF